MKPPLIASLLLLSLFCDASAQPASQGEALKQIVRSPPPAYDLQFEVDFATGPKGGMNGMLVIVQPGKLLARGYSDEGELTREFKPGPGRFLGESEGILWDFEHNPRFVHVYDPREQPVGDYTRQTVDYHEKIKNSYIAPVVNLGVPFATIGSIRWNGEKFEAVNKERAASIRGYLAYSNGIPLSLIGSVTVSGNEPEEFRTFMSDWGDTAPYPGSILVERRVRGEWTKLKHIRIKKFVITKEPPDPTIFSYAHYTGRGQSVLKEIGGQFFEMSADGKKMTKVLAPETINPRLLWSKYAGRYIFLSALLVALAVAYLAFRKGTVQKVQ